MLTEIRLDKFKCFGRPTTIPTARISVFIGPNGSGKSSPIQALMLLKQSLGQSSLVISGDHIKLGDFRDIAYRHDENAQVTIGLSTSSELDQPGPTVLGSQVTSVYTTVSGRGGLISHEADLSIGPLRLNGSYHTYFE